MNTFHTFDVHQLHALLMQELQPTSLVITDTSSAHAGHHKNSHHGCGIHISIEIETPHFLGKTLVQCHRLVQNILKTFFDHTPLHSVQIRCSYPS